MPIELNFSRAYSGDGRLLIKELSSCKRSAFNSNVFYFYAREPGVSRDKSPYLCPGLHLKAE